jgi:hypothetical protein
VQIRTLFFIAFLLDTPTGRSKNTKKDQNGTHQPVVCTDDVNLLGENVNITKQNTEALLDACKDVGL